MNKPNILLNLLVSIKTNYLNNNKEAYCKFNKFCLDLLFVLYKDGLINNYKLDFSTNKIKIGLKYIKNKPLITNLDLISKPSLLIFSNFHNLKKFNYKYDYFILTTSDGLLSSRQLRNEYQVGGQVLFGLKIKSY